VCARHVARWEAGQESRGFEHRIVHKKSQALSGRAAIRACGPEGASLTLRYLPQCSLPNLYRKMTRAFRDM